MILEGLLVLALILLKTVPLRPPQVLPPLLLLRPLNRPPWLHLLLVCCPLRWRQVPLSSRRPV